MKSSSSSFSAHLDGEVTTLCTCWRLTRADGVVMGFTDHDRDLSVGGVTYRAASGYTPSAVATSASLAVDNLDVDVVLDDEGISEADLRAGLYDHATVEVLMVNWAAPTDGGIVLSKGHIGEVTCKRSVATAEIRGLAQALATNIGEYFSADCRAALGDARCGVDLAGLTVSGTVTGVESRRLFTVTGISGTDLIGGLVTFTSGACAGLKMEVKACEGGSITLFVPMPREIAVGDSLTIQPGCDKSVATCHGRFDNVVNFRGEPFVPGQDKAFETPNARSG